MTILHEFRGVRCMISELADMSGVNANTIYNRLKRGWTVEQAVCIPTREQMRRGVVMNFPPVLGTGAGESAQEIHKITFSKQEHSK